MADRIDYTPSTDTVSASERKVEALSEFILGLAALIKFIDSTDPKAAQDETRRLAKLLLAADA